MQFKFSEKWLRKWKDLYGFLSDDFFHWILRFAQNDVEEACIFILINDPRCKIPWVKSRVESEVRIKFCGVFKHTEKYSD